MKFYVYHYCDPESEISCTLLTPNLRKDEAMMGGSAYLDDIVLAILHHLRAKSVRFTANREAVQRAFHATKSAFPQHLGLLSFRSKGFFPESLGLDQALANLEASRLLHRQNEAPLFYEIDSDISTSYERFAKERLEKRGLSAEQTREIADRLSDKLKGAFAT